MQVLVERPCATSFHIFAKRFGTSSLLAKRLAIISFFAFFFKPWTACPRDKYMKGAEGVRGIYG